MPWINTVPYEEANGRLKELYDRVKGPDNNVDNIMMMHSLRPHSMEGHMAIYKYIFCIIPVTPFLNGFLKHLVFGLAHLTIAIIASNITLLE